MATRIDTSSSSPVSRRPLAHDGVVDLPVKVSVSGRLVDAALTGTLETRPAGAGPGKFVDRPRVEIAGDRYPVSDAALDAILEAAGGYEVEPGHSSRTRVFGDSPVDYVRKAVVLLDGQLTLAPARKQIHSARNQYHHDAFVAVNGPGLPRVSY